MNKVAIISKDTKVRFFLHHCIPRGFVVEGFGNLAEFQKYHGKEIFALVMIDTDLHLNELYIYQKNLRHRCSPWIALSSTDKVSQIIKILGTSIDDVLPKPIIKEQFRKVILQQVVRAKLNPHYDDDILSGILVGRSPAIRKIRQWIYKFAATDDPILITGESGTGKEVVAECLFKCSTRRKAGFFPQNIAAIPKDLIATTLFGAISGAYTGAKETPGLFESCGEGTVFLDEIGEIDESGQTKLLRVLETGEFSRVGSSRVRKTKGRVITATNRDLFKETREGLFRLDLYHRLNVLQIHLPPLRERREDVGELTNFFLDAKGIRITHRALVHLTARPWTGNVRELLNTLKRAALTCEDGEIDIYDL